MSNRGLQVGDNAPLFEISDIEKKTVNLEKLLQDYQAVMLDFFRGSW